MKDNAVMLPALATKLSAIATAGLASNPDEYAHARYDKMSQLAAELQGISAASGNVEREYSGRLDVVTPVAGVDAAIFDAAGCILLIQRADNHLWAMPGGGADVGESASAGAVREAWEETGLIVQPTRLLGVYDSRLVGSKGPHHIYHFTFECVLIGGALRITNETLAYGYFAADNLPPLSGGHNFRVPDAFKRHYDGGATFH